MSKGRCFRTKKAKASLNLKLNKSMGTDVLAVLIRTTVRDRAEKQPWSANHHFMTAADSVKKLVHWLKRHFYNTQFR